MKKLFVLLFLSASLISMMSCGGDEEEVTTQETPSDVPDDPNNENEGPDNSGDNAIDSLIDMPCEKNEILYTTTDNRSINLNDRLLNIGISSHTYRNGVGKIKFVKELEFIPKFAFSDSKIEQVKIPSGISKIEAGAFADSYSLRSINIPASVTYIGEDAFSNSKCERVDITDLYAWCNIYFENGYSSPLSGDLYVNGNLLTDLVFPDGSTNITYCAFQGCKSLINVTIPNSVTSIGAGAFMYCSSLKSISIPDGVTWIKDSTFDGCKSLTSIIIPDSVTTIGEEAFRGCEGLTSITLGDGVTLIQNGAFLGCSLLKSVHITDVAVWCRIKFEKWTSNPLRGADLYVNGSLLTDLTIPDGITQINNFAFQGCSSITNVILPYSVTAIGEEAFAHSSFTSMTIHQRITSIGDCAFKKCDGELIIKSKIIETDYDDSYPQWISEHRGKITIGDNISKIGSHALRDGSDTVIMIPENVTKISEYAFRYCTGELIINSPYISSSGDSDWIQGAAFTKITIGNNISSIGAYKFHGCKTVESVEIPNSVTTIGDSAFCDCTSLANVTIPNSVATIGNSAFCNCTSLTNVIIPKGVTSIAGKLFYGCSSLANIIIPDSVTSIGDDAFYGCTSLVSVIIPDSVTSIGKSTFYDCFRLAQIYCMSQTPPILESKIIENDYINHIYVPIGCAEAYKTAEHWNEYASKIEEYDFENNPI